MGAISFAFPLVFLFISVAGGFTVSGGVPVAQYTGASSERSTGRVVGQTLVLYYKTIISSMINYFGLV